jgi:hypothetical protein
MMMILEAVSLTLVASLQPILARLARDHYELLIEQLYVNLPRRLRDSIYF